MISIIVPIYKIENFLPECIESLLAQTYQNIEIILVDDGSPDRCPKICDNYAAKFSNIKVVHKANGGLVSARQAGILCSRGEYIGYVDGDDWVERDMFRQLLQFQLEYDADIVVSGFTKEIGNFTTLNFNSIPCGVYDETLLKRIIFPRMLYDADSNIPGIYTYVWNKMFRRSVIYEKQMVIPQEISIGEDAALVYPALLKSSKVCVTENAGYHYRQRANSMLKNFEHYSILCQRIRSLRQFLFKALTDAKEFQYLSSQIENYVLLMLISLTGGVVELNGKINFFGYDKSISQGRILLYGAGTVGQHLYRALTSKNCANFSVVQWVDPDYFIYREHGLKVDDVHSINTENVDLIIIAMLDKFKSCAARKSLIDLGVPPDKISAVNSVYKLDANKIFKMFDIIDQK